MTLNDHTHKQSERPLRVYDSCHVSVMHTCLSVTKCSIREKEDIFKNVRSHTVNLLPLITMLL